VIGRGCGERLAQPFRPLRVGEKLDPGADQVAARRQQVETGKALVIAGLHPATGGTGMSACSGDMLLEALVACAGVTMSAVATAIGIELRSGSVQAEGDLDFRGTLGVAKEVPVGFQYVRLQFTLDTDATEEQLATLMKLTERYCVVYQTLAHPPALSASRKVINPRE